MPDGYEYLSRRYVCRVGDVIWVDDEFPRCRVVGAVGDAVHAECLVTGQKLAVTGVELVTH